MLKNLLTTYDFKSAGTPSGVGTPSGMQAKKGASQEVFLLQCTSFFTLNYAIINK